MAPSPGYTTLLRFSAVLPGVGGWREDLGAQGSAETMPPTAFAGGKTTVLELAAELTGTQSWDADLCPDPAMRAALNASVAVAVTYTAGMDVNVKTCDKDPELGLALRVLYSALVQGGSDDYPFAEFWSRWDALAVSQPEPPFRRLYLQTAIGACFQAFSELAPHRTGMLLLINETRMLAEDFARTSGRSISDYYNGVNVVLSAVSRTLGTNCSNKFNVVLTTHDFVMLENFSAGSRRPLSWVCLDGLRQPAAEVMIMRALGQSAPGVPVPDFVALGIADCARHPRTLDSLGRLLRQRSVQVEQGGGTDWYRNPGELQGIRRAVAMSLNGAPPLWAVRAALIGDQLPYNAVIESSGGKTFGDAIAEGLFTNTCEDPWTHTSVPRLSFMQLLHSANANATLPVSVRAAILRMAEEEERCFDTPQRRSNRNEKIAGFEGFVLKWLQLRFSLASAPEQALRLGELFPMDGIYNIPCEAQRHLRCRLTTAQLANGDPETSPCIVLTANSFADAVKNDGCSLFDSALAATSGDVTPIAKNSPFDLLLLVREPPSVTPAPPLRAILIKSCFSSSASTVRRAAKGIAVKAKLFIENLRPGCTFDALGIPADRVTYVVLAPLLAGPPEHSAHLELCKELITVTEKKSFLAKGVMVLDREGVARAFSPTLADHALVLLERQLNERKTR